MNRIAFQEVLEGARKLREGLAELTSTANQPPDGITAEERAEIMARVEAFTSAADRMVETVIRLAAKYDVKGVKGLS